ncbi:MAG: methyltransferase domain-containing protein [Pseudomonadota bacterium]
MDATISSYNQNADDFNQQYMSKTAEEVHQPWITHMPNGGQALDVGAGVGRDAKWLAENGYEVVAVEPAKELRKLGEALTKNLPVFWLDDTLPALSKVFELEMRFDLILLSAVWMHIPKSDRERAFRKIANLLKPGGVMVITLRHGKSPDKRIMHTVSVDELSGFAQTQGLIVKAVTGDTDKLNRQDVHWQTMVFSLPDDGSGAFPTIRNILINDAKASTYKLALVRVLLRIADGHPGAVLRREDKRVILPLGLVSLYWARQYLPLVQKGIQQNGNANKGMGFIKEDGWKVLEKRSASDFAIGNLFLGDDAIALHKMLKTIGTTIKNMPAKYITLPNSDKQVFEVDAFANRIKDTAVYTDFETLSQYGEFSIPEKVWDLMSLYACWIEPVAINEWVNVMQRYEHNKSISKQQLFDTLEWINPKRTTDEVKKRVESIKKSHPVSCIWSDVILKSEYEIDHCLPFARWPNNDLWNLLPASKKANRSKSDKIASNQRLLGAKENISQWWQEAWLSDRVLQKKFNAQVIMSLPGLKGNEYSTEDIFDALSLQHVRVREMQQLVVW